MARYLILKTSLRFTLLSLALLLSLFLLLPLMTPAPALATTPEAGWQSVPLTANFTRNEQPQIDGDLVVWRAYDGVDWEIMLIATHATRRLDHKPSSSRADPLVDRPRSVDHPRRDRDRFFVLYELANDTCSIPPQNEAYGSPDSAGDLISFRSSGQDVIRSPSTTCHHHHHHLSDRPNHPATRPTVASWVYEDHAAPCQEQRPLPVRPGAQRRPLRPPGRPRPPRRQPRHLSGAFPSQVARTGGLAESSRTPRSFSTTPRQDKDAA